MIPSRGLRPSQIASLASRCSTARSGASRKFSLAHRRAILGASASRTTTLYAANRRAGAGSATNIFVNASAVRYGSWYAPWTWGRSSAPSQSNSELSQTPEPVTTATPELAPAGIDKAPVVESTTVAPSVTLDSRTVEDVLRLGPTTTHAQPTSDVIIDPTAPISYWGNLKDLGLDYGWGTSSFFENIIELSYLNTTLGWSGSIVLSTVVIRCILFWFQVRGSDSMAKMAAMKPLLQPLMDQMEAAKRAGDEDKVNQVKAQQQAILKDVGADMFKNLGTPIAQAMLGWGAFRTLRGMTALPVPGLSTDGLFWLTDLTVSDPTYLLPAATGGLMFLIMRMGGETGMALETQQASMQKYLRVIMPAFMTVITALQPGAIQLYFFCSAGLGGLTAWILRQPSARSFLKIRQIPTAESQQLYSKVVKGEVKLSTLRGADGRIRYQAPKAVPSSSSVSTTSSTASKTSSPTASKTTPSADLNLKPGTALPLHMRKHTAKIDKANADRDIDYDAGMPSGWDAGAKWDWLKRNYRLRYVAKRLGRALSQDKRDTAVRMEQERREKAKAANKKYEEERRRRFESGR